MDNIKRYSFYSKLFLIFALLLIFLFIILGFFYYISIYSGGTTNDFFFCCICPLLGMTSIILILFILSWIYNNKATDEKKRIEFEKQKLREKDIIEQERNKSRKT